MFQRRHYEAIARMCALELTQPEIINAYCVLFKYDNPNFNETRFRDKVIQLMNEVIQ